MEKIKQENLYDVVVIGGGPAGLTAALYLARAQYRVVVVEKESFGGQITITSEVVNFPGVLTASGRELTETMRRQAQSFGAEFLLAEVENLDLEGDVKAVRTSRGELHCFGVLLATGAHPRSVGFEGEDEFKGRGVAYCATCDGEFFTGKEVFVVGGGFAAAEESVFLTKYASHVTILIRREDFSCAKSTADAARANEKITVVSNVQVESVSGGDNGLKAIRYRNRKTGEVAEYHAAEGDSFGVFVFAGYEPATALVRGIAELNEQGYVITDRQQKTSVDGLYAAGDVCVKNLRQVVTAVGDGATAATELEKYAASMQKKTGLFPVRPVSKPVASKPELTENLDRDEDLFTEEMRTQLETVFSRMARPLILRMFLDDRPVSRELEKYMTALANMTEKLSVETAQTPEQETDRPCVHILQEDGSKTGLAFHGVPGGHEFTSFVLGLYNAAGPGQSLEPEVVQDIASIAKPVRMQLLVSLSCTMCPELVTAAQRIAAGNENVQAEVYDLNHFPALKEYYKVMSVPCLVINDSQVSFGKKSIRQLLDLISAN
ncbi:MAG: FAD-dependent oxidoreductase [Clostridia bacterium]|nr:FAD-dependent oxidoreductase [Clostridia bacterium]